MDNKYSVIDLFAGAGGLSLGFEQTQKFEIKVAFENSPDMQKTYKKNHPNVDLRGDVCIADYAEIKCKHGDFDVVIGGPPCQGFSNANRQKNHAISQNNMLVKQFLRAIIELQPKAFIMENVSMLKSEVHRFYMEDGDDDIIKKYKIPVKTTSIHLLDEQYFYDGVLDIIGDESLIKKYLWDELDYTELNVIYKTTKNLEKLKSALEKHKVKLNKIIQHHLADNKSDLDCIYSSNLIAFTSIQNYYNGNLAIGEIKDNIELAIMYQRMLGKASELIDHKIMVTKFSAEKGIDAVVKSYAVYDYIKAILGSKENGYTLKSEVLCAAKYGAPQKRMRFVIMGIKRAISPVAAFPNGSFDEDEYRTVRDAIEDLENVKPVYELSEDKGIVLSKLNLKELGAQLRNADKLYNHIITRTTGTALARFRAIKQGNNFHSLDEDMKSNTYTDASRTQNTIYLRLNYDEPCGTVVNVRKSMWIHPTKNRAISIREAARLQTFPDSFIFCGSKDKQYQQVGNAVPPIMAKAVAKKLAKLLNGSNSQ